MITGSLASGDALRDDNKETWKNLLGEVLPKASGVFALRGAGSWNGMDKHEVDTLLKDKLIPRIEDQLKNPGLVVVMHDGDYDDLEKPDIGYVAGRLLDRFGNNTQRVVFVVAQKESWHPEDLKGRNLVNSNGRQYVTYLFPDETYPGDHSSFTQDEELVQSEKYEQWYIGASGLIADGQLADYESKTPKNTTRKATFYRVANNSDLDQELQAKIKTAEAIGDSQSITKLEKITEQRKRKYGLHWNNDGLPALDSSPYPHLRLEFVF